MEKIENLIIGAGPAGIGAALRLGKRATILERNAHAGGQSASIEVGEAVFDIGGHSFHTPHPFVRDIVYNSLEMYEQVRQAYCYSYDTLIPYPFQKHFRAIGNKKVVDECAAGLEQLSQNSVGSATNFQEFILNRFGKGIAEHFMTPYNEKLWARDLKKLDAHWVGERVAAPEGIKEKFELEGGQRKPLQTDSTVSYPAQGGFGEIYKALAQQVQNIELGVQVNHIDLKSKKVYASNNTVYTYGNLISTLPLNELMLLIGPESLSISEQVAQLEYMSLKCILVAINHPVDTPIQRIYSADGDNPAHKIAINHNSSDWLRNRRHHGIMGEVSYSKYKHLARPDLEKWFLESLQKMGIIKGAVDVLTTKIIDVKYAYPVPTHNRMEIVSKAKSSLQEHDVYTLGRFGEWAYINSDEALARGMILGEELAGK